jgi:hypothetical protein
MDTDLHRVVARAAGVIGLLAIALIHLLDLQSKMHETPYLGAAYLALIAASLVSAAMLLHGDNRKAWTSAGALSLATIAGYAINRTVGMPSSTADIGNWLEPLGLASLFVEAITVAVSLYALSDVAAQQPARKR